MPHLSGSIDTQQNDKMKVLSFVRRPIPRSQWADET